MTLNETIVRIGVYDTFDWQPYQFACGNLTFERSEKCPLPGFDAEIAEFIFKRIGRPYELVNCGPFSGEININGSATHCSKALKDGEVDVLTGSYFQTAARQKYFDYSVPLHFGSYLLNAPIQIEESVVMRVTQFLMPFTVDLWILFFAFMVSAMGCKTLLTIWKRKTETSPDVESDRKADSQVQSTTQTKRACGRRVTQTSTMSLRQLATSWSITSMLCLALYRSFLLSSMMMNTSVTIPIHDYDSLVNMIKTGDAKLYIEHTDHITMTKISNNKNMLRLRKALVGNPSGVTKNYSETLDGAHGHIPVTIKDALVTKYEARQLCNVHTFAIDLDDAGTRSWMFRKNVSWLHEVNSAIIQETAAITFMTNNYIEYDKSELCDTSNQRSTPRYVTTDTLMTAAVFLFSGHLVAAICVIGERTVFRL